jgi:uncharacterized integral membrane protein
MIQLLLAIVMTVGVVVFSMANNHHVEVNYVFGEPIRIRLIFLLGIAFIAGSVSTLLYQLTRRVMVRARERERELWIAAHVKPELEEE